jgi:hypothetical protein
MPGYEKMLSTITWWLPQIIPYDGKIIELWRYGALAEAVLMKLPEAQVEIWDIDSTMLGFAKDRLREFASRVVLRERSFTEPLTPCNAVVATLSLL